MCVNNKEDEVIDGNYRRHSTSLLRVRLGELWQSIYCAKTYSTSEKLDLKILLTLLVSCYLWNI